jgi:hypothetical protein
MSCPRPRVVVPPRIISVRKADHAPGIFAYQPVSDSREPHKIQCLMDAPFALLTWQAVQLGEDQKVFITGKRAVD